MLGVKSVCVYLWWSLGQKVLIMLFVMERKRVWYLCTELGFDELDFERIVS